jgi:hypothetical protein
MTGGNVYGKTDGVDELYGWSAAMSDRLSIISRAAHPMDTLMQDAYAGPLKPEAPAHAADHVRIRNLAERLEEYEAKELEWEKEEKRLVAENRSLRAKLSIAKGTVTMLESIDEIGPWDASKWIAALDAYRAQHPTPNDDKPERGAGLLTVDGGVVSKWGRS